MLKNDCLPSKTFIKWLFTTQKLYKMTAYQAKTLQNDCLQNKNFIKWLFTKKKLYKLL
jgi:hypothetical protein